MLTLFDAPCLRIPIDAGFASLCVLVRSHLMHMSYAAFEYLSKDVCNCMFSCPQSSKGRGCKRVGICARGIWRVHSFLLPLMVGDSVFLT